MTGDVGGSSPSSRTTGPEAPRRGGGADGPEVASSTLARSANPKLYGVVDRRLGLGMRAAQVGHALIQWVLAHGRPPENLILLQVEDRYELIELATKLRDAGTSVVVFHEPDLGDRMTALAVGPEGKRFLRKLPLAMPGTHVKGDRD